MKNILFRNQNNNVNLDKSEVLELIQINKNLISFIVNEGKELVCKEKQEEYVRSYMSLFDKSLNGSLDYIDMKEGGDAIQQQMAGHMEIEFPQK